MNCGGVLADRLEAAGTYWQLSEPLRQMIGPPNKFPKPFNKLLQPFNKLLQPFNKLLQPFNKLLQPFNKLLQPFNKLSQPINKFYGRLIKLVESSRQLPKPLEKVLRHRAGCIGAAGLVCENPNFNAVFKKSHQFLDFSL
jgi:hypothetical protein